jgi:cyclophilin family peptidyl-prolyl cis-trans isomerase
MLNLMEEEPSTSAKVVFETNYGSIEVDLWANETPITSRHIIQACIDGHFDNASFTRVIQGIYLEIQGSHHIQSNS